MSLIEVKNQIVEHIIKRSSIGVEDFVKIKVPDEFTKVRDAMIREALKDLEESKFVRGLCLNPEVLNPIKTFWVLEAPIGFHGQQVDIDMQTASLIASVINRYREANEIKDEFCNALAIDQSDLQNLCGITLSALQAKNEDAQ